MTYWLSVSVGRAEKHLLGFAIGEQAKKSIGRSASRKGIVAKVDGKCPRAYRMKSRDYQVDPSVVARSFDSLDVPPKFRFATIGPFSRDAQRQILKEM